MTLLAASLRAILDAYQAEEPPEFRVAEQFGLEEASVLKTEPPRAAGWEKAARDGLGA